MFTRISVSGGIRSLYCGLTNPLALKKLFGSEARLNSTHGLKGAFDTASATVPSKTPAFGPRRIVTGFGRMAGGQGYGLELAVAVELLTHVRIILVFLLRSDSKFSKPRTSPHYS